MVKNKYNIGDRVHHATPESDLGIVVDASYFLLSNKWVYNVTFSHSMEPIWYNEHELSESKIYV